MTRETLPMAPLVPGALLVALPHMLDPNFMHSVVFLCAVGDAGTMGFVLGESTGFEAGDLLSAHEDLQECGQPVFNGGPVGRDQVHFLHRMPTRIGGGTPVGMDLWLGGDFDDLARALRFPQDTQDPLKLFVGYAGWGANQLEHEIAEQSWLVLPPKPELAIECNGESREELWRRVLRSQGPQGQVLSQQPPDPTWN